MTHTKPWMWLLVASLALNVFLGVTVGTHFFREPPKGPPARPGMFLLDMAESLPEDDARILRQAFEAHKGEFPGDMGPPHGFDRMRDALVAEPFDLEAFLRMESEFRANREREGAVIGLALAEALPKMSPEGRKRLAAHPPRPPRPR